MYFTQVTFVYLQVQVNTFIMTLHKMNVSNK